MGFASRQSTESKSEGGIHAAFSATMGLMHTAPWDLSHIFDEQREKDAVSLAFSKSLISFSGTKDFLLASWHDSYHRV